VREASSVSSSDQVRLLERLLEDPGFRARFRDDPVTAVREAGLEPLVDQVDGDGERALETLEIRESRSSLAGMMLAASVEGLGCRCRCRRSWRHRGDRCCCPKYRQRPKRSD
jgi:hypothetical protein